MQIQESITKKLSAAFSPYYLSVENESHMHNVPENSETHFKVTIATKQFEGKALLQRHKAINTELSEELEGPVHALALHTYTSDEWSQRQQSPESPKCLGGNKL